jgi:hypothetical protein
MIKPSKAVIAGAAVAGLLTGSFAVRAYAASTSGHAGVLSRRWRTLKRANMGAKARTNVRARAGARPATPVAKERTPVKARGLRNRRKQASNIVIKP